MKPPEVKYRHDICHIIIRTLFNEDVEDDPVRCYSNIFSPQILAMIEEAAGTRMYECKKISAQKTIEKKEAKLKEIQTVCRMSHKSPVLHPFTPVEILTV